VVPRLKQMTVVGTLTPDHYEYDATLVLMHMDDAARIFRLEGPTGIRLKLRDLHQARSVAASWPARSAGDCSSATGRSRTAPGLRRCNWKNA
jgi:lipoprotein-releasing system permease protein